MQKSHYFKCTHIRKAQTLVAVQSEACALSKTLSINRKTYIDMTTRLPKMTGKGLSSYP